MPPVPPSEERLVLSPPSIGLVQVFDDDAVGVVVVVLIVGRSGLALDIPDQPHNRGVHVRERQDQAILDLEQRAGSGVGAYIRNK